MGLTFAEAKIINPANPKKQAVVKFLVDSGAIYSSIPSQILKSLGVKPHSKRKFILANGEEIERDMGDLRFEFGGEQGASTVIFGKRGDSTLLGITTLENLGLMLDPLRRQIKPLPMILGGVSNK